MNGSGSEVSKEAALACACVLYGLLWWLSCLYSNTTTPLQVLLPRCRVTGSRNNCSRHMERHNAELELQLATPLHNRLCKSRRNILEAYGYICSPCSWRADAANTGTRLLFTILCSLKWNSLISKDKAADILYVIVNNCHKNTATLEFSLKLFGWGAGRVCIQTRAFLKKTPKHLDMKLTSVSLLSVTMEISMKQISLTCFCFVFLFCFKKSKAYFKEIFNLLSGHKEFILM